MIAFDNPYDPLRALLLASMAFLAGALVRNYVAHAQNRRTYPGMLWGAWSAFIFIGAGVVEEISLLGSAPTWRFPVYAAGVVTGLIAVWRSIKRRRYQ